MQETGVIWRLLVRVIQETIVILSFAFALAVSGTIFSPFLDFDGFQGMRMRVREGHVNGKLTSTWGYAPVDGSHLLDVAGVTLERSLLPWIDKTQWQNLFDHFWATCEHPPPSLGRNPGVRDNERWLQIHVTMNVDCKSTCVRGTHIFSWQKQSVQLLRAATLWISCWGLQHMASKVSKNVWGHV